MLYVGKEIASDVACGRDALGIGFPDFAGSSNQIPNPALAFTSE
jgi:hypothetical protein